MSETPARRMFLLDGSALAYRAHFAFAKNPLSNDAGLNTGAIFGYVRTLLSIMDKEKPSHIAVAFDTPEPTFRHLKYPDYKATREKMPEEMIEQLPYMKKMTDALGIRLIEIPGWEADDVIGTLAKRAESAGFEVDIVTGDKDFMQLVSPRVRLYDILKGNGELTVVDEAAVIEKFGVPPAAVIDVLALMGDSSDNVPGVPGIGGKTATELIVAYGSVDGVLAHVDDIKKAKLRENLTTHRELALLSRDLVTIRLDAPVGVEIDELACGKPDIELGVALCRELKFNSLMQMFARLGPASPKGIKNYHLVRNAEDLDALCRLLASQTALVVDTETTGLDTLEAVIVGFSFACSTGEAWYVPLLGLEPPVLEEASPKDQPGTAVVNRLRPVLEDPRIVKVGQNVKYDMAVMLNHGIELANPGFDTMIASYLLEPGSRAHDLDSLALRHFDYTKIPTTDLIGTGKDQMTMDHVPVDMVAEYAAEDADYTWRLYEKFAPMLGPMGLESLFRDVEMPLAPILMRMERAGVRVDTARLKRLEHEFGEALARTQAKIFELAGGEFNIASPKQLAEVLFERLKLHEHLGVKPTKTKTGFSTNQEVLESLSDHPLPALIIEHRSLAKLLGTYVTALPAMVSPRTGHIHTTFNQAVAATGRLSSSDPNLQNIPIRTALGRKIREAFIPSADDWELLSADYSQIELRILAHMADDPTMIAAFRSGTDIHRDTAARIFGKRPEDIDSETRSRAKSINFGILYGMGPQRLARETDLSLAEAQAFIERYFNSFPTVRKFLDGSKDKARQTGEVTTLFGRRRPLPDIHAKNGALRSAAENMAVNTPIQGTAADIIKMAMIRIDAWIREAGLRGKMVLQVHDELVFDVPKVELDVFRSEVPRLMSGVVSLSVPLTVDLDTGF